MSESKQSINQSSTQSVLSPVNIVGAGLAGCMAALLMSQQGENVRVLELRDDWRLINQSINDDQKASTDNSNQSFGNLMSSSKRSYNIGVSHRGLSALDKVGLLEKVQQSSVAMTGRALHQEDGSTTMLRFSGDNYTLSVRRDKLSEILMNAIQRQPKIELIFNAHIKKVDSDGTLHTAEGGHYPSKFTIGSDGAHSKVRQAMQREVRMNYSIEYADWGYKELHVPAINGEFALNDPACLHVWPRDNIMILCLPNPDKTFSMVVVMRFTGPDSLETIVTPEQIIDYFSRAFPDLLPLIPDLVNDWISSPCSSFLSLKCDPWLWNHVILIGDAAHATSPFIGQGLNAAFEDCMLLTELYQMTGRNVDETLTAFNAQRVEAGQALCDISMDNFTDVRVRFTRPMRMAKYFVDTALHRLLPNMWMPLFDMVTFTRIPYDVALRKARQQDQIMKVGATLLFMLLIYLLFGAMSQWTNKAPRATLWTV